MEFCKPLKNTARGGLTRGLAQLRVALVALALARSLAAQTTLSVGPGGFTQIQDAVAAEEHAADEADH